MKIIAFLTCLVFIIDQLAVQQRITDSLAIDWVNHPREDRSRLSIFNGFLIVCSSRDPGRRMLHADRAVRLTNKFNEPSGLATPCNYKELNDGVQGKDSIALDYWYNHEKCSCILKGIKTA